MADKQSEIPHAMRDLAEQNLKQAHAAYGQLTDFVTQAFNAWMGLMPSNPMTIGLKNVQAHAQEFVTVQTQFAEECMQAFFAQTQHLYGLLPEAPGKQEQGTLGAPPSNVLVTGFKDVQSRVVDMAKKNAESASSLVEKIAKAQDTQQILALQTKFVQDQMQAFVAQTQEIYGLIGDALQKSARS